MDKLRMLVTGILGGGFSLPFSVDFSALPDGAYTGQFVGAPITISSGYAVPNPTLGAELYDPGADTFEAAGGIYHWTTSGTNTLENDAGQLKATYVDNATGAQNLLRNTADLTSNLTVGRFYQFGYQARVNAGGNIGVRVHDTALAFDTTITETNLTSKITNFLAKHVDQCSIQFRNFSAGEIGWLDNVSLKAVTTPYAILPPTSPVVTVKAGLKLPTHGGMAGLIFNADSQTNPLNFGLLVAIRDTTTIGLHLYKFLNGTPSLVVSVFGTAYTEDAVLEIRMPDATTRQIYYNNAQKGTNQTISDSAIINSTHHGIFNAYGGNSVKSFFCL